MSVSRLVSGATLCFSLLLPMPLKICVGPCAAGRRCMQACCIQQHSRGTVHKIATNVFLEPDKPITELLPYSMDCQTLFHGSVPQPADWLRAFSACKNAMSFLKAEKHYESEDYAQGRRCSVNRRSGLVMPIRNCFVFLLLLDFFEMVKSKCSLPRMFESKRQCKPHAQPKPRLDSHDSSDGLGGAVPAVPAVEACCQHFYICR